MCRRLLKGEVSQLPRKKLVGERRNYSNFELRSIDIFNLGMAEKEAKPMFQSAVYFCAVLTIVKTNIHHHNISKGGRKSDFISSGWD